MNRKNSNIEFRFECTQQRLVIDFTQSNRIDPKIVFQHLCAFKEFQSFKKAPKNVLMTCKASKVSIWTFHVHGELHFDGETVYTERCQKQIFIRTSRNVRLILTSTLVHS